jgi:tRNA(adenine34) deaminase
VIAHRRAVLGALAAWIAVPGRASPPTPRQTGPERGWYELAVAMKAAAESQGDQPYGAVLVLDGVVVGEGPSRVVAKGDPDAHAEREAIGDALRRLGRPRVDGAVLYSTSRPCARCEAAAAEAGVARMIYGPALTDAGRPARRP